MALFNSLMKETEEEQIGLIQGRKPDSIWEWWTAQALWRYKIPFMYQFQLFGSSSRRGDIIVDFAVWNRRFSPLLVHGDYCHEAE